MPDKTPQDCPFCGAILRRKVNHSCTAQAITPTHPPDKHQRELHDILLDLAYDSMGVLATTKHEFIMAAEAKVQAIIARTNRESRIDFIHQIENIIPIVDVDAWPSERRRYSGEVLGKLEVAYLVQKHLNEAVLESQTGGQ